jgi:hypothetical protein
LVLAEYIKIRYREKDSAAKQKKELGGFFRRGRIADDEDYENQINEDSS